MQNKTITFIISLLFLSSIVFGYLYLTEKIENQNNNSHSVYSINEKNDWVMYKDDKNEYHIIVNYENLPNDSYTIELLNDNGKGVTLDSRNTIIKHGTISEIDLKPDKDGNLLLWTTQPKRILQDSENLEVVLKNLENKTVKTMSVKLR